MARFPGVGVLVVVCLGMGLTPWCWAADIEPWRGNRIGISDTPPPPFTAMSARLSHGRAQIDCWGRTYTLADTGFPVQIRSKDADLLATPMRLVAESAGASVEWKSTGTRHTEVMGHNYGLSTLWLEQWRYLGIEAASIGKDTRFLMGLALLYDFSLWSTDGGNPHLRVYKSFAEFGAMEAEFIPFWHLGEVVRGQTAEVRCSAYRKPEGGTLLAFFNRGEEAREITFRVDWAQLKGPGPLVVRDALPAGMEELVLPRLPVRGNRLTLTVPPENFRLVAVE